MQQAASLFSRLNAARASMIASATALLVVLGTGPAAAQQVYIPDDQQRELYEAAQAVDSDTVLSTINLFANIVDYQYPSNFVPVFKAQQPGQFMLELIPYGENVKENWSEMLTVQSFAAQLVRTMPANALLGRVSGGVTARCPQSAILEELDTVKLADETTYRVMFGCGDLSAVGGAGMGEVTIAQATKRGGDIVIVQYAMRVPAVTGKDAPMTDDNRDQIIALLDAVSFSDNPNAR